MGMHKQGAGAQKAAGLLWNRLSTNWQQNF
jgi:hypothetical protein